MSDDSFSFMRALFSDAKGEELLEAATANFVAMIEVALDTYPAPQVALLEEHYVQLFDGLLHGWGTKWVLPVFAEARARKVERSAPAGAAC